jgi:hypothetical protein
MGFEQRGCYLVERAAQNNFVGAPDRCPHRLNTLGSYALYLDFDLRLISPATARLFRR